MCFIISRRIQHNGPVILWIKRYNAAVNPVCCCWVWDVLSYIDCPKHIQSAHYENYNLLALCQRKMLRKIWGNSNEIPYLVIHVVGKYITFRQIYCVLDRSKKLRIYKSGYSNCHRFFYHGIHVLQAHNSYITISKVLSPVSPSYKTIKSSGRSIWIN